MKIGDLVRPFDVSRGKPEYSPLVERDWIGIVIGFEMGDPVVYWNEDFKEEREYREQLELLG